MTVPTDAIRQLRMLVSTGANLDNPDVMQLAVDALSEIPDPEIHNALYSRLMAGFSDDLLMLVTDEDVGSRGKILDALDRIENRTQR